AANLGVPHLGRIGLEVVGEVLGRARLVGAVNWRDGQVGKIDAVILRGDGCVVPVGDVALEDAGDGCGVHVERVDAVQVEDDGDGRNVGGDLDDGRAGNAGLKVVGCELVVLERTVGAGEG